MPGNNLDILPQPDDSTCGPTCLQAVYGFYGDDVALEQVISEVMLLEAGGTLAVMLGCHALERGYRATIYTYNLHMFDPTWFAEPDVIPERLRRQKEFKSDPKLQMATSVYLDFLRMGGVLRHEELAPALITRYLQRGIPILTGLSATYLYGCAREVYTEAPRPSRSDYDDVRGEPTGHFVVLSGWDERTEHIMVADPLNDNPLHAARQHYQVGIYRLIGAILLGILTYDANLLVIEPMEPGSPDLAPPEL